MMQNEVSNISAASPLAGVVLAAVGVAGYFYSTIVKWFEVPVHVMAQATVPGVSVTWPEFGQYISGAMVVLGSVVTWLLSRKAEIDRAAREKQKEDADAVREERQKNADAARDARIADMLLDHQQHMLAIKEALARQSGHIDQQDVTIQSIRDAVQTTEPAK